MSEKVRREVDELVKLLTDWCTGDYRDTDHGRYRELRERLMRDHSIRPHLPPFLVQVRDLNAYWREVQAKWGGTYMERRAYLQKAFSPVYAHLEALEWGAPADAMIQQGLFSMNAPVVGQLWDKALSRRASDPDGAITAARSLLETVCKHVLDDLGQEYAGDADLPALYRLVRKELRLSPEGAIDEPLKHLFGGCTTVVESIGVLRNRVSDAHGRAVDDPVASKQYAALAVNLAGAMAVFLCEVWDELRSPNPQP